MSSQRFFTPHEATQTLPLVKRIVKDILEHGQALRQLYTSGDSSTPQFTEHASALEACSEELEELGCSFKDWNFELGLVDFPSRIDNEPVLLCWRSDEPELRYYHGLHDGYAGRKPIPECLLQEPSVGSPDTSATDANQEAGNRSS